MKSAARPKRSDRPKGAYGNETNLLIPSVMVKVVLVLVVLVEVVVLVVVALVSSLLRNNVETGGGPQLLEDDSMNGIENDAFILIVSF